MIVSVYPYNTKFSVLGYLIISLKMHKLLVWFFRDHWLQKFIFIWKRSLVNLWRQVVRLKHLTTFKKVSMVKLFSKYHKLKAIKITSIKHIGNIITSSINNNCKTQMLLMNDTNLASYILFWLALINIFVFVSTISLDYKVGFFILTWSFPNI